MASGRHFVIVSIDEHGAITIAPNASAVEVANLGSVPLTRLEVSGGVLTTSALDPELRLTATIERPSVAGWWINHVYGNDVADAVADLAKMETAESRDVETQNTELSDLISRLMLGLWMRRWRPSAFGDIRAIREWLLDAELGELAWRSELVFGSIAPARELLAAALPEITAELAAGRRPKSGDGVASQLVATFVNRAALAALDTLFTDTPGYGELDRLLTVDDNGDDDDPEPQPVNAVKSEYELVAGDRDDEDSLAEGATDVDWGELHPRSVNADLDAVDWTVTERDGERWIDVTVRADVATFIDPTDFLSARVFLKDADTIGVALDRVDNRFEGTAYFPKNVDLDSIRVDIYSDSYSVRRKSTPESKRGLRAALAEWFRYRAETAPTATGVWEEFVFELDARENPEASNVQ